MLNRDWTREDMPALCDQAKWLLQIVQQGFFSQVGDHFTPAQYDQALTALTELYERFKATLSYTHFSSPSPRAQHFCLEPAFEAAKYRLKGLLILRPLPAAPPPPPAKKKPLTPEQTVKYLEEVIQQSPPETYLGPSAVPGGEGKEQEADDT